MAFLKTLDYTMNAGRTGLAHLSRNRFRFTSAMTAAPTRSYSAPLRDEDKDDKRTIKGTTTFAGLSYLSLTTKTALMEGAAGSAAASSLPAGFTAFLQWSPPLAAQVLFLAPMQVYYCAVHHSGVYPMFEPRAVFCTSHTCTIASSVCLATPRVDMLNSFLRFTFRQ